MSWISRLLGLAPSPVVDFSMRSESTPLALLPPARAASGTFADAVTLSSAFRALQVLATSAAQLPLTVERGGITLAAADVPALVRAPSLQCDRAEFIEQCVMSLASTGDLFVLNRGGLDLQVLAPAAVAVDVDARGAVSYRYGDRTYRAPDVLHRKYLALPGRARGLGPIEAARLDIKNAVDARDYGANWFSSTGEPSGILSTAKDITPDQARGYRQQWNEAAQAVDNPSRIRVIGSGFAYNSLNIKPSDAQWLESRKFSTVEMARLFGVPGSLMLAAPEGNVQSYANVEQEWIAFIRFTLMNYLVKIESIFTDVIPRGQRAKFNVEGLLRADTGSRYAAYSSAIFSGWLTPNEVRTREGYAPLTPQQISELEKAPNGTQTAI